MIYLNKNPEVTITLLRHIFVIDYIKYTLKFYKNGSLLEEIEVKNISNNNVYYQFVVNTEDMQVGEYKLEVATVGTKIPIEFYLISISENEADNIKYEYNNKIIEYGFTSN